MKGESMKSFLDSGVLPVGIGRRGIALLFCLALYSFANAQENYSTWTSHKKITINTTASGANIGGDIRNFPVLVRLTATNFTGFGQVKAGGADIRFSRPDFSKPLAYEIERWDAANSLAEIWVKVDTVFGNSSSQYIVLHYGNNNANSQSSGAAVFDTANGFRAVYHLSETASGTAGAYKDATYNAFNGTGNNPSHITQTSSAIGLGQNFDSTFNLGTTGGFISLASGANNPLKPFLKNATISCWVKTPPFLGDDNDGRRIAIGTDYLSERYYLGTHAALDGTTSQIWYWYGDAANATVPSPPALLSNSYYYLSATWADTVAGNLSIGFDSAYVLTGASTNKGGKFGVDAPSVVNIGNNNNGGSHWYGQIDEVRIENVSRSKDWLKLSYESQKAGSTIICFSPGITTQPLPVTVTNPGDQASLTVGAGSNDAVFQWQKSPDGQTWTNASDGTGAATANYKFNVNGDTKVRCILTSGCGAADTSASVSVALVNCTAPKVTSGRPADTTVYVADSARFSITAAGSSPAYQWQSSSDGVIWKNATKGAGATTNAYGFKTDSTDANLRLRCIVSGCNSLADTSRSAVLSLCYHVGVLPLSTSISGTAGQPVSIVASATGKSVTYSWQRQNKGAATWDSIAGAHSATYTFTCAAGDDGASFRCKIGSACDGTISTATVLTVCVPVKITTDPKNDSIVSGDSASFAVAATGTGATYQWLRQNKGSAAWDSIKGVQGQGSSYKFAATGADDGASFKCIVKGECGVVPSASAVLVVCSPVSFTLGKQPSDTSVNVGDTAIFTASATGTGPAYKWQKSTNGGGGWNDIAGATGTTLKFKTQTSDTGFQVQYRCVATGTCGSDTSKIARIGLCFPASMVTQPHDTETVVGKAASFTVEATGTGLTYQWERKKSGETNFSTISNATGKTYAITGVSAGDSGTGFRCQITGRCGTPLPSSEVMLRVWTPVAIGVHPRDTTIKGGDTALFRISASGTAASLKWQRSRDGGVTWDSLAGFTTTVCKFKSDTVDTGALFRCIVSNKYGSETSTSAKLTLCYPIVILAQPSSVTNVTAGQKVGFAVNAQGVKLAYRWQKSMNGGPWADLAGQIAARCSVTVTAADSMADFKCRLSSPYSCGDTVSTAASIRLAAGAFTEQTVKYMIYTYNRDTTYWADGALRIINSPSGLSNDYMFTLGKVRKYPIDSMPIEGFIVAGPSLAFRELVQTDSIQVSMRAKAIPAPYRIRDARLYRYDSTCGCWLVERNSVIDSVGAYVSLKTDNLKMPFAVMIDTMPPKLTLLNHSPWIAAKGDTVRDTVEISDNIGNLLWRYRSVKGGYAYPASVPFDTLHKVKNTVSNNLLVTAEYLSNGIRASIQADDGRNSTAMDLSRRVKRDTSDAKFISTAMRWTPLRVTASLDNEAASQLIKFVDPSASNPAYDVRTMRLVRWLPSSTAPKIKDNWVDYADNKGSDFDFKAGRLFWIKTRNPMRVNFGSGITLPPDTAIAVDLATTGWTDFGLPFQFSMRAGDIISATRDSAKTDASAVDSLRIYQWNFNAGSNVYECKLAYSKLENSGNFGDDSIVLDGVGENSGFTVQNPTDKPIRLVIPSISSDLSKYGSAGAGKRSAVNGWMVEVRSNTGSGAVYCGADYSEKATAHYMPMPPALEGVRVGVVDEKSGTFFGGSVATVAPHLRKEAAAGVAGGFTYLLGLQNDKKNGAAVTLQFDALGNFPSGYKVAVYNGLTGELSELKAGSMHYTVSLQGEGTEYRSLIIGTASYIGSMGGIYGGAKLAFDRIYPNPMRGIAHLRYTLPFGRVGRVEFSILDISGRQIWQTSVQERAVSGGVRECRWNGMTNRNRPVAAGVYIVKMRAFDYREQPLGSFEQRITLLK
jgi:hypothetical protein